MGFFNKTDEEKDSFEHDKVTNETVVNDDTNITNIPEIVQNQTTVPIIANNTLEPTQADVANNSEVVNNSNVVTNQTQSAGEEDNDNNDEEPPQSAGQTVVETPTDDDPSDDSHQTADPSQSAGATVIDPQTEDNTPQDTPQSQDTPQAAAETVTELQSVEQNSQAEGAGETPVTSHVQALATLDHQRIFEITPKLEDIVNPEDPLKIFAILFVMGLAFLYGFTKKQRS